MHLKNALIYIAILLISVLSGCSGNPEEVEPIGPDQTGPVPSVSGQTGCRACHQYQRQDGHADLACPTCHAGNNRSADFSQAHLGLVAHPADPRNMQSRCGSCHQQTDTAGATSHFTLKNETNMVRRHFGADQDLQSLLDIPITDPPATPLQLVDDLLRRRCLRCHVYYAGDDYPKTSHGTGCAACHLEYQDGHLVSHDFQALPADNQCLSCHYGNRVGSDYYGRFASDFKHEYRTPYQTDGSYPPRPYGIEQHQLRPDIHQLAGMTCIDCHVSMHAAATMGTISCAACHLRGADQAPLPPHLRNELGKLTLTTRLAGRRLIVPAATDVVHSRYQGKIACPVCHAGWSYNDQNTNLLRIDHDDYGEWDELMVQESFEAEVVLSNGIYGDEAFPPTMTDKISGRERTGLWLKGYKLRRWEEPIIDFDRDGILQVMRPILDLQLSWVDEGGRTVFDASAGQTSQLRPYTPHTIGRAGAFYRRRIGKLLPADVNGEKRQP